jgi:hypothetical protein
VLLIQVFQGFRDGSLYWSTYMGVMIRFLWAYLVIKCAKIKFFTLYVKILYFFSRVSLVFYTLMLVIPNSKAIFQRLSEPFGFFLFPPQIDNVQTFHIIIYNFHGYKYEKTVTEALQMIRNSGPFWEPGVFMGFLMCALFFLYLTEGTIKNKKGLVFIIAIITTFSTTGYIALIVGLSVLLKEEYKRFKWVIIPLFLLISVYSFFNLAFLNNKIQSESKRDDDKSRFGAAQRDLLFFYDKPIIGNGRSKDTEYGQAISEGIATNGLTTSLATMGILYYLLTSLFFIFSLKKMGEFYNRKSMMMLYVVYTLLSFSEVYFMLPMFMGLSFLYITVEAKPAKRIKRPKHFAAVPAGV